MVAIKAHYIDSNTTKEEFTEELSEKKTIDQSTNCSQIQMF